MKKEDYQKATELEIGITSLESHLSELVKLYTDNPKACCVIITNYQGSYMDIVEDLLPITPDDIRSLYITNLKNRIADLKKQFEEL